MITSDHICAKKHIVEVSLICPNYLGEIRSHQESKNLTKSPAVSPRVHSSHQVRRHVGEIQSHQESHQHGCALIWTIYDMVHNMNCDPLEHILYAHLNGEWSAEPSLTKMVIFERMMMSEYTFWLIWTTRRIL